MQADCKGKQVWFTRLHDTDNGAFLRKDGMLCMAEDGVVTPFLAQKDVKLRGLHNIENLLAAAAAVWGEVPVEAIRQVGLEQGKENCCFIHVVLVPYISGSDEYKSKPAQHSVKELQGMGVNPDIIILRADANVGGEIRKVGYIDLMNIQDPQRLAKKPLTNGVLAFPFFTIENVDVVDDKHIVVGNDNNLPFSSSRDPNKADDNELVLLQVEALLKAR
jgi:hypothetical protein